MTVVVASAPRTGSTLLCVALRDLGLGRPGEYLHGPTFGRTHDDIGLPRAALKVRIFHQLRRLRLRADWSNLQRIDPDSLHDYLETVTRATASHDGVVTWKVHWEQYQWLHHDYGFELDQLPGPKRWIHVRRRDHVAQAASLVRAQRSGHWQARDPQRGTDGAKDAAELRYDDDAMLAALDKGAQARAGWARFFADLDAEVYTVHYEDLAGDYERTVRELAAWLGLEAVAIAAPSLRRQADEVSAAWIGEFRRRHPELSRSDERVVEKME